MHFQQRFKEIKIETMNEEQQMHHPLYLLYQVWILILKMRGLRRPSIPKFLRWFSNNSEDFLILEMFKFWKNWIHTLVFRCFQWSLQRRNGRQVSHRRPFNLSPDFFSLLVALWQEHERSSTRPPTHPPQPFLHSKLPPLKVLEDEANHESNHHRLQN